MELFPAKIDFNASEDIIVWTDLGIKIFNNLPQLANACSAIDSTVLGIVIFEIYPHQLKARLSIFFTPLGISNSIILSPAKAA